jgi:hypothetical protein
MTSAETKRQLLDVVTRETVHQQHRAEGLSRWVAHGQPPWLLLQRKLQVSRSMHGFVALS